jgi:hypothetical protein
MQNLHKIHPLLYATEWFSTLFVAVLPFTLCNKILDCFLFEGVNYLLRVGLALLHTYQGNFFGCPVYIVTIENLCVNEMFTL